MNTRSQVQAVHAVEEVENVEAAARGAQVPRHRSIALLIREVKQRRVCRAAVTYVLVMWLNLQIGDVLFPMLDLPSWSLKFIIILGAMGFPAVLILAWVFQVTPQGVTVDALDEHSEGGSSGPFDSVVNVSLLVCSFALTLLLIAQFVGDREEAAAHNGLYLISDVTFLAASTEQETRAFVVGVEQEVRHRLVGLEEFEVLAKGSAQRGFDDLPRLILSGTVARQDEGFRVLVQLLDLSAGQYVASVAFDVAAQAPGHAERIAAERIIAQLNGLVAAG